MREIGKWKSLQTVIMNAKVAHEAGVKYQAWRAKRKGRVRWDKAMLKYNSIYRQVLKQFMKEGKI